MNAPSTPPNPPGGRSRSGDAAGVASAGGVSAPVMSSGSRSAGSRDAGSALPHGNSSADPAAESPSSSSSTIVGNRYEVLNCIGTGGMGTVYKAFDRKLKRHVAMKRLRQKADGGVRRLERFLREATILANLSHENVVRVFDVDQDDQGHYLVMELVEGLTLKDRIDAGDLPDVHEAAEIGRQVAAALEVAHQQSIIHRDVKPANIIITREHNMKLTDFGLARWNEGEGELTQAGAQVGTFDFMAPEQLKDSAGVDTRCDLYGLGATLYQSVTGEVPRAVRAERIPAPLRSIVLKAMEHDPDERFQTARELAEALQEVVSQKQKRRRGIMIDGTGGCHQCGHKNADGIRFCTECGASLFENCPECEHENRVGAKHCGNCGFSILERVEKRWAELDRLLDEAEDAWSRFEHQAALRALDKVLQEADPIFSDAIKEATERREAIWNEQQKFEAQREKYYIKLRTLMSQFEYKELLSLAETIPREYFNDSMRLLVDKARKLRKQVKMLSKELNASLAKKEYDTSYRIADELWQLQPQLPGLKEARNYLKRRRAKLEGRHSSHSSSVVGQRRDRSGDDTKQDLLDELTEGASRDNEHAMMAPQRATRATRQLAARRERRPTPGEQAWNAGLPSGDVPSRAPSPGTRRRASTEAGNESAGPTVKPAIPRSADSESRSGARAPWFKKGKWQLIFLGILVYVATVVAFLYKIFFSNAN